MQKGLKSLGIFFLAATFLTACTAGSDLKISYKKLTEEEKLLIETSGGISGDHFILEGKMPDNQYLEITVEQYEKGEMIFGEPVTTIENDYGNKAPLSFAVRTTEKYGHDQMVIGIPGGSLAVDLENIEDDSIIHGPASLDKMTLFLNKPIYGAYWVSSSSLPLATPNFLESAPPDMTKYDNAFLFKVELKER